MGYFYLDLHPREGKYSHACSSGLVGGCNMSKISKTKNRRPRVVVIICNFPEDGCITFGNVKTLFHEFGHAIHGICSKTQLAKFCGSVERDFVEVPSQLLEFWCYCKKPLQMVSSHKDTGEPIPEHMIKKLRLMKGVLSSIYNKGQLMYGIFDLRAHMMKFNENSFLNSRKLWNKTCKDILGYEIKCEIDKVASFKHLINGYDAGYYGYLRAETYAANIFYKHFENGNALTPEKGMEYRKKILAPGSTKDALDLLRDLLGEDPDDTYFLIDKGLKVK